MKQTPDLDLPESVGNPYSPSPPQWASLDRLLLEALSDSFDVAERRWPRGLP
jgi:hypothetical protein